MFHNDQPIRDYRRISVAMTSNQVQSSYISRQNVWNITYTT